MQKSCLLLISVFVLLVITACQQISSSAEKVTATAITPNPSPDNYWETLLQHTPVPWTTPLPPLKPTLLDATYVKTNPRLATPFPCFRCPDYGLEGGIWKFQLEKGIFRIYHALSGWRSLGSYTVDDNQILFFNDPYCNLVTGIYNWTLEDGVLELAVVRDDCSQGLRAVNLIDQPWHSCRPPNPEAMITDHWQKPEGCDPD